MKLWQDRDEETPVRWFFTKPGAKLFEPVSSFRSIKTWARETDRVGMVGEVTEFKPWSDGANTLGYEGVRHCGSDLAMQEGGLSGRDPVIVTSSTGDSPCCKTPPRKQVCIIGPQGEVPLSIPLALKVTIVNRGVCPMFPALPLFAPFSGHTPFNDPVDPGFGNFCTAGTCYWMWATGTQLMYADAFGEFYTTVALGLNANGVDLPTGCSGGGCSAPFLYWKIVFVNLTTGTRSVQFQSCTSGDLVESLQVDPFKLVLRRLVDGGVTFVCQYSSAGNPLTATHFVFEEF